MTFSTPGSYTSPGRRSVAAALALVYLLILLLPVVTAPLRAAGGYAAAAGECSGNCDICGCSPELRATNRCCCALKRQLGTGAHQDHDHDGDRECCQKKPQKETVITCACPLGGTKEKLLASPEGSELLPVHFATGLSAPHCATDFVSISRRLLSRHGEPPDPPPDSPRCA